MNPLPRMVRAPGVRCVEGILVGASLHYRGIALALYLGHYIEGIQVIGVKGLADLVSSGGE